MKITKQQKLIDKQIQLDALNNLLTTEIFYVLRTPVMNIVEAQYNNDRSCILNVSKENSEKVLSLLKETVEINSKDLIKWARNRLINEIEKLSKEVLLEVEENKKILEKLVTVTNFM